MIKFITDFPAVFIQEKKILMIADPHIGLEYELFMSGIKIPKQVEKFKKQIDYLLDLTKAHKLIILGDIKHKVPGVSVQELKDIPIFLEYLKAKTKVILVRGNHDSDLQNLIPSGVKVYGSRGFKLGKYGFFHGHAWPSKKLMQCNYLFMSHTHPAIEFRDKLGYRSIEPVWVRGKLNQGLVKRKYKIKKCGKLETIILPAFNRLLGGVALNSIVEKELIGPLLANKFFDVDNSKAYLLDGTLLGNVKLLKKFKQQNS